MVVTAIKIPFREGNQSLSETPLGSVQDVPWIVITRNTAELQDTEPQSLAQDKSREQESTDWDLAFQITGDLSSEYVALFLNSEDGLSRFLSRSRFPFRVFMMKDGLTLLDSMPLPRLSNTHQAEIITAASNISAIRAQLSDDVLALWSGSL
jgi:hypothetical protein